MSSRGYGGPPDPRSNPFANPPQRQPGPQYPQPGPQLPQARSGYDTDSDMGDNYGSYNSSTTRLAAAPGYLENSV